MKKLRIFLIALICFSIFTFTTVTAFAEESTLEGENLSESEILSESKTLVSERESAVEPKFELTASELKEIIDGALSENQKEFASSLSTTLANYFNLSPERIYLIVALGIILLAVVLFFVGKYVSKLGKIKSLSEQVKALGALAEQSDGDKQKYKELVEVLSKAGIEGVIKSACDELEKNVCSKLKLDSKTISDLLLKADLNIAYVEKIVGALKILAHDAGKTAMLNELAEAPESAVFARILIENAKMRNELGEEAVSKILL